MKKLLLVFLLTTPLACFCQAPKNFLVGINFDLIKSDNDGYFEKAQIGFEGNYFFSRKFAATAGLEVWTRDQVSLVLGSRWFPNKDVYIRARGLIGENDFSIGGGWAKPMTEELRFESMADFYFSGNFTIRAGLALMLK